MKLSEETINRFGSCRRFGVTAYSLEDAKQLLLERYFKIPPLPQVTKIIEKIDVSSLDQKHVTPNMNPPNVRGIWFPKGFNDW